ncbi:cytochrome P450 [Xylariaceae sp. FL1651]|nr:cytochrome P450 [Xylariaceae sp. FL1651]
MPPGPIGRPLLGSLLPWLQSRKQGSIATWLQQQAQYGEMTTLSMGTRTWVLLNSERVLNEIIAKKAGLVHERPDFPIAGGLVSRNHRVFLHKTDQWRESRRLLHQLMYGEGLKDHSHLVEEASLGLLQACLDEPRAWYAHNYRYAIAIMHQIATSTTIAKSRAELEDLQRVTSTFLTSINTSLVDFFPQLALLPNWFQLWRPFWKRMGDYHYSVFRHWWCAMKEANLPESSFVRKVMFKEYTGSDDQAMYITLFILSAGADNPRMTMNAFFMACLAWPEAIQRMRNEIDSLCGSDNLRLPDLDDLAAAPYTCAVVKEVLRWRPTVPLIPQRVLVSDLEFEGYLFPAGTEFLVNTLSVCRQGIEEAHSFKPERWLEDENEKNSTGAARIQQDLWQFAFNAGRRSCIGYKLAQKELFVAYARLAYCFDITASGDFNDTELNAFALGEPFPVQLTVRSSAHEHLIRNEATKCGIWGRD